MELRKITFIFVTLLFLGCSKEEEPVPQNNQSTNVEFKKFNKFDQIGDLVMEIGENPSVTGRQTNASSSFLPPCATVTTTYNNDSWTRIVDFGTSGCTYFNGAVLKGQIIYSGLVDYDEHDYIINYTFDDFSYDNIEVVGEKNYHRYHDSTVLQNEDHPIFTIDIDLTLTYPNADVYTRVGTKTKEFVEGFDTLINIFDNKHLTIGNWSTSFNGNIIQEANILSPLEKRSICPFIRSGELEVISNNDTYNINYGNGDCDNEAQMSINGGTPFTIHF